MQCCCPPPAAAILGQRSRREQGVESLYNTFQGSSRDKESDLEKSKEEVHGNVESAPCAYYNLLNTIVGGGLGLMIMPTAALWSGIVLFPIIVFLASVLNFYTADLLAIGGGLSESPDYGSFIGHALGPSWRWVAHVLLFLSAIGSGASIVELSGELFCTVCGGSFLVWGICICAMGLALMLVSPSMDSITPLSQATFVIVVVFLCWMIYESASELQSSHHGLHLQLWPPSFAHMVNSTSLIILCTCCQQNALPIYTEIQEPKRSSWVWSLSLAVATGAIWIILSGVLPVIVHPSSYEVLALQFAGPLFGKVLACLLGIGFVLFLPLNNVVGSIAVYEFVQLSEETKRVSLRRNSAGSLRSNDGNGDTEISSTKLTIAKVVFSIFVAAVSIIVPGLENVLTITSALTQCPLYYIMPCLAFYRVSRDTNLDTGVYAFGCIAFVVFLSSVLWVACLYSLHALNEDSARAVFYKPLYESKGSHTLAP